MKFFHIPKAGRSLALAALAVSVLAVGPMATLTASAHTGVCRSDPVIYLSNGKTVTLYETISDVSADVTGGNYILHGPMGTSVTSASWSGTLGSQQSLTYYADQKAGDYSASSTVLTKKTGIPVTAYMQVDGNSSKSSSGYSNTPIYNSDHSR